MTHYFIQSWKSDRYDEYMRRSNEGAPFYETSSAAFTQRRVKEGDQVYAVFVKGGKLYLIGKMEVERSTPSWKEMIDLLGIENVYKGVSRARYLIAKRYTRMHFSEKPLPLNVVKKLRFVSRENPTPKFVDDAKLDKQTLRNVRELTQESATRLDECLKYKRWIKFNP